MTEKVVRTRKAGVCSQEFCHPNTITPGDVVLVTTVMPSSELARDFGAKPWTRFRTCSWCLTRRMESRRERERTDNRLVERWRALTGNTESGDSSKGVTP